MCTPAVAWAHGDPASDYLSAQDIFLPFNAKVGSDAGERLVNTVRAARTGGYRIKVAVIGTRYDLGTAFSLYKKAQQYAEFLGLDLSAEARYRDPLLVVMPNGYGVTIDGRPDRRAIRSLQDLPPPGTDATKQVEAATTAIRKLAAASGHVLPVGDGGGESKTRDRITIAAGATALLALLAAIVFYRRERTPARE